MTKKQDAATRFRNDVLSMYRAGGCAIEEYARSADEPFDFIAIQSGFAGMDVRIAVACLYSPKSPIGPGVGAEFKAAFEQMREARNLTFGILVSNKPFAAATRAASAGQPHVRLMTRDALDDELLGARIFLENAPGTYRTDASNYILLSASSGGAYGGDTDDIAATCIERLSGAEPSFTLLLGDFGTGKTTVAERTHRELCRRYLAGRTTSFPIILYLRTLDQSDSEDNFIDQHLRPISNRLGAQQLETLRRRGGLTFILDGYDEVATNAREEDRLRLSSRVMRLINRADRVMLTSRPSYFTSIDELNKLVDELRQRDFSPPEELQRRTRRQDAEIQARLRSQFAAVRQAISGPGYRSFSEDEAVTYHINPLGPDDIVAYFEPHATMLKKRYAMTPRQVYDVLASIYDLTDLLTRPLLLEMFVTLLESEELDLRSSGDLGPAAIYSLYVELHLAREWNLRKFLLREERRAFARTLAIAILEAGGSLEATYDRLAVIVRSGDAAFAPARRELLATALADVVTDVRICAFISMTPGGRLEFSHKSFMEFFVAEVIITELANRRPIPILDRNLNYEILYFLGSFCVTWSDYILSLMNHLRDYGYSASTTYRNNLKVALLYCERHSKERTYSGIDFAHIRVAKRSFEECEFEEVALRGGQFVDLHFASCAFTSLLLEGEGHGLRFQMCTGQLQLPQTIQRLTLVDCRETILLCGENGRQILTGGEITACGLILRGGHYIWTDVTLNRAEIVIDAGSVLTLSEATIEGGSFVSHAPSEPNLFLGTGLLRNVRLNAVHVSLQTILDRGMRFRSCRGILLVNDPHREIYAFTWSLSDDVTRQRQFFVEDNVVVMEASLYQMMTPAERTQLYRLAVEGQASQQLIWGVCAPYFKSDPSPTD